MDKIQLQILGISSGHTSTSYTLILEEVNGSRKLPVIIGAFEAQAIAIEIEKIIPVRPMTHDLIKAIADSFHIQIKEVLIHKLQEGVFYASIVCLNGHDEQLIDARTSDAIAIALRFKCPIYTYEPIMQEAGIILNDLEGETRQTSEPQEISKPKSKDDLTTFSNEELEKLLEEALEFENYIYAAKIRDEIQKRSEKK
jgi:bifunctional DNase/RNase